jgi:hypothetical protein
LTSPRLSGDAAILDRTSDREAPMEFVQVIEFTTTKYDDIRAIADKFVQTRRTGGGPKPQSVLFLKDRDRPNTYRTVARFASYEEAMENSNRDDTTQMAQQIAALCDDQTFRNLDVLDEVVP